jgi:hypothetical protein
MIECVQCHYKFTNQSTIQLDTDIEIVEVLERLQQTSVLLTPQQHLVSPFRTPTRASMMMQSNPAAVIV